MAIQIRSATFNLSEQAGMEDWVLKRIYFVSKVRSSLTDVTKPSTPPRYVTSGGNVIYASEAGVDEAWKSRASSKK